jgi:tetratricopeptide (TPR) repeat protein
VEPMAVADRDARTCGSFERRMWGDAFAELSTAHREGRLGAEDLERLAVAAYMVGTDDACQEAWVAAHHEWLRRGDAERAAHCAFWQALGLLLPRRHGSRDGLGCPRRPALGAAPSRLRRAGMAADAHRVAALARGRCGGEFELRRGGEIAERFANADATMFARLGRGYSLILQGRVAEGMALLDEVMISVTADEVAPMLAGIAYCQVIDLCQAVFDLRRAREWTEELTRRCGSQPDMVPFRGNCLVHRCEIFQLHGAWTDALESARRACEWLAGPPTWDAFGSAYYQLAEIQRLRGLLVEAEESYRRASLAGRDPEPGMSLLRLAQGRIDLALPAIRRALEEAQDPIAKVTAAARRCRGPARGR